jgi:molybdopterin synthase sulfur carrier subunit
MVIKYFATLRDVTNIKEENLHLPPMMLSDLIQHLCGKYGKSFEKWVSCDHGGYGAFSVFLVNGRDYRSLDGYETKLKDGDEISIFPPVAGG